MTTLITPWPLVDMVIWAVIIIVFFALAALILTWAERKIAGFMQDRLGPMEVGRYHGILQPVADALKLLQKEDVVPLRANPRLHLAAPALVTAGAISAMAVIPWWGIGPAGEQIGVVPADLNIGIFYFLAISSLGVIGILMAGWGSANKWSLLGAMRGAAQIVSYEIPVGIAALAALVYAQSLSTVDIVNSQAGNMFQWTLFKGFPFNFFGGAIFALGAIAEGNRLPFDMPESESELVAGFHTEYSGIRFAMFFLAEYGNLFVAGLIITVVYLGGWYAPFPFLDFIPGVVWTALKMTLVGVTIIAIRWALPRLRVDQLMALCWKYMIPLALVCLFGASLLALIDGPARTITGVVLFVVLIGAVALLGREDRRPAPAKEY
jgi:NADH-quinone oxidoreductase subunit H